MAEPKNSPAALPNTKTRVLMGRLLRTYVRPYVRMITVAFVFMIIAAAMTAAVAQLMQPILDDVLNADNADRVWPVAFMVLGTFILRGLTTYAHVILMNKVGHSIVADIQKDLFGSFMRLELAFFHAHPSGQLISRVVNDVQIVRTAVSDTLTGLGKSVFTLIFLVAVMFYQDWKLALAAFVVFPFAALFVAYIGRRLRVISRSIQHETGELSDRLSQIFHGIRQVKAYGMEAQERSRAGKAIDRVAKLNIKSVRVSNMSTPINEILIGFVVFGIILYGGAQASSGAMTAGQLGAFLAAFMLAYEPMKKLAKLNNALQMGLGAAERVFEMIDREGLIKDRPDAKEANFDKPEITFENVSFHYENAELKALDDVSFSAKPGKVTALVGPSGGGKSTIINMIPRFYDVQQGAVKVGGQDVREVTRESLRRSIALVSQDITIFDDSVAANIAYGSPQATDEEIIEAAKKAAAHEFITGFPEGYDTRVGEDGVNLSGGQRQRIAIARAILRDAPILLLDEATSALDNESEKLVQDALQELEKGRTTIVIAHRLSTVQHADQIIVLNNGRIAEQGRHDELQKRGGIYARMLEAGLKE